MRRVEVAVPALRSGSVAAIAAAPLQPLDAAPQWSGDGSDWLQLARTSWHRGDWTRLAALGQQPLQRHPDRARLALLAASGHFQLGANPAARRLIGQALDWGCDRRLVSQLLVSGLHNTLGRAAAVLDQPARAWTHFATAIVTASAGGAVRSLTQSRASEQLAQLGLAVPALETAATPSTDSAP